MNKSINRNEDKVAFNLTLNQINHYQKKLGKYAATGETEKVCKSLLYKLGSKLLLE